MFFHIYGIILDMERDISRQLAVWKERKPRNPLMVTGARQVGKTYILKAFGQQCFPHYHYFNFEEDDQVKKIFTPDLKPRRILDELSFYVNAPIDSANDLLIFDEIQHCPRALTSLKYFAEDVPELAICCAGSLLGIFFGESSFPVGKADFLSLYPLSFGEFLSGIGESNAYDYFSKCTLNAQIPEIVHARLWELWKVYLVSGGLPAVVNVYRDHKDDLFTAVRLVREKQQNLILAYEADMARHSGKQNSMHINRLWRSIPSQLAREQDGSASKFKFKEVIPGIKGFERLSGIIDWLLTAGLVIKTHIVNSGHLPFTAYAQDNFFKLYFFDIGILGAISGLSPRTILNYDYGSYKGYMAENFAAQEFLCAGANDLFAWREGKAEVEFLREVESKVVPIEIKSGWVSQSKSLNVFAHKYAPPCRVIMSARNLHIDAKNRLHRYPLYLAARFPLPG